jgi:hypothetical protein
MYQPVNELTMWMQSGSILKTGRNKGKEKELQVWCIFSFILKGEPCILVRWILFQDDTRCY